ncbi:MAG TPA: DmsE family decaheme c-type cytochrome [Gemmatimonadaceae bacterium]|nr:DmsE family decaheme c-type cytochrome [Gemmatimonadaceae bacterium]
MHHMREGRWLLLVLGLLFVSRAAPAQQQGYAGSAACVDCHKKEVTQFGATTMGKVLLARPRTEHEKLGCEACHGPARDHAESGGEKPGALVAYGRKSKTAVADRNATCLRCHETTARIGWKGSQHESRNVACTDCHAVMHPVSERANLQKPTVLETCARCHLQRKMQSLRFAHMPVGEGKMECTSCHNPHGSPNEKLLLATSVNETCFACHAEKRGPFLWQHAPVIESCANCHDAHGTAHEKLLKVPKPRLCQQCHNPTQHPTQPRGTTEADARFVRGRQCISCHFAIHGSNHPSGKRFTR